MDDQWVTSAAGPSSPSSTNVPEGQPLKSPSNFPRSHFYTEGSDSGEDSHMVGFVGPSSSEDNFNSQVMVGPGEDSEAATESQVNSRSNSQTEIEGDISALEVALDDQATVRMSLGSDTSGSSEGSSVSSDEPRQTSSLGKAPIREESSSHSASTAGYQADMSTTLDGVPSLASNSRRNTSSSRFDRRYSYHSLSSRRTSTQSTQSRRTSASQISLAEQPLRSSANPTNSSSDEDGTPTISRSSEGVLQQQARGRETLHGEVIVPRWQPDSEVTQCPICSTSFGWLSRKHHCRKCGRVVCNSCSPHRITIPYQYIVQPPDHPSPYNSTAYNRLHDPQGEGRTNTSEFGGGDRVRLSALSLNLGTTLYIMAGHKVSIVPTTSSPGSLPAESRFRLADHRSHTVREQSSSSRHSGTGTNSNPRTAEEFQSWYRERAALGSGQSTRSRSSTVAVVGRDATEDMRTFLRNFRGPSPSLQNAPDAPTSTAGRRHAVPVEDLRTRPLPRTPQIREEDECPICHRELPSSSLANAETLRSEHIISCIERTTSRISTRTPTSTPAPPIASTTHPVLPVTLPSNQPSSSRASASSTPGLPPLISTLSSGPSQPRRTGVFPYIATEKDCQDDAECQICLEEYEPGLEMGRLECFYVVIEDGFWDDCMTKNHGFESVKVLDMM
ncbi:hypothetical protein EYC80_006199 [Monilinia laxa]|uniref:RING-type E3 ubiquitin transferase n=1 Tax=Monilinia laxa TaxID=61186 RepID=A0A5N6KGP2_MONLA|nr:hypothetical protein EYC80_006199 [Monilinia laxa]